MKNYFTIGVVTCLGSLQQLHAQDPCSGIPGPNTVIPMSQTVCAGSIASMSLANTYTTLGITYQWQSSTISPVGPFSSIPGATLSTFSSVPLPATIWYNVVITCTNSNQIINIPYSVTVVNCASPCNGAPAATSIVPASSTVCVGSQTSMSLTTTYTNTGVSYQWGSSSSVSGPYLPVPGATLSTFTTGAINTNSFYNVVVTCTNSGLSYTTTQAITAVSCTYCSGVPGPNSIVPDPQTICAGTAASMSLASSYTASGFTYKWGSSSLGLQGPFTAVPNATLSSFTTPTLSTTMYYNVLITCTNSGQSVSVTHAVNVINCNSPCSGPPFSNTIVASSPTICSGDDASLSFAIPYNNPGFTFQWLSSSSQGGPYMAVTGATLSTYTTPPLTSTMYYGVIVTCTNSNLTYSTTQVVSVVSCTYCSGTPGQNSTIPVSHTICAGNTATIQLLNGYNVSGITYQWGSATISPMGPFVPVPGAQQPSFSTQALTLTSFFNVVVTCTNSGKSLSIPHVVTVVTCTDNTTGVSATSDEKEISVYPNPAGQVLTIIAPRIRGTFVILDVLGKTVVSGKVNGTTRVNTENLPGGIYFLKIEGADSRKTIWIIKE